MKIKILPQYAGEASHFDEINCLLSERSFTLFRALVGYVSIGGLKIIEDKLLDFLNKGNFVDWIVGMEGDAISKDTLDYLLFLKEKFPDNVQIRIFTAGCSEILFHPKIYWLCNEEDYSIIIGSSNFTEGGLKVNFEASALLSLKITDETDKTIIHEFENLWQKFSTPAPPLNQENLIALTKDVADSICQSRASERPAVRQESCKPPHPFLEADRSKEIRANIKRLHGVIPRRSRSTRRRRTRDRARPNQLIMDILTETRDTQVQIPTEVLAPFFGIINTSEHNEILLTEILNNTLLEPKIRPLISQRNKTHRFEISGIKGRLRPLIVKFLRTDDEFEYEIISKSHPDYDLLDKLLTDSGTQKRTGSRRWILIS